MFIVLLTCNIKISKKNFISKYGQFFYFFKNKNVLAKHCGASQCNFFSFIKIKKSYNYDGVTNNLCLLLIRDK